MGVLLARNKHFNSMIAMAALEKGMRFKGREEYLDKLEVRYGTVRYGTVREVL